jgi:hypothetical protein
MKILHINRLQKMLESNQCKRCSQSLWNTKLPIFGFCSQAICPDCLSASS